MTLHRHRHASNSLEPQRLLDFVRQDRESLLRLLAETYPSAPVACRPPAAFLDEVLDMLGFRLAVRELPAGAMAFCDFGLRLVSVAARIEERVRPNTDLQGLKSFTKAHELGHIRLGHEDAVRRELAHGTLPLFGGPEPTAVVMITYHEDLRGQRPWRERAREREADLYATEFLVPFEWLDRRPEFREIVRARDLGRDVRSELLWSYVYDLAHWFEVSPGMMKKRLVERGLIVAQGKDLAIHPQRLLPLECHGLASSRPERPQQLMLDLGRVGLSTVAGR